MLKIGYDKNEELEFNLDKKHKGYGIIMTLVTLLVICQVLPLNFTIVLIGWSG